ncbi:MAG: exonuclease SbcCD subunit D C-terminal domain-containing protein [Spirochaetales bacterium]|nr:exonuclease SbcCD subunit D C-terminal domain-containing protein [Spirochaetales bacterium]
MNILHTSDWHIGRLLNGKRRYQEFEGFFSWLLETLDREKIDILLVAGDIFDNANPSNQALELYYNFLAKAAQGYCKNIIITAGNHDSPSVLNAPKELLKFFNISVIGNITESEEDEVVVVSKENTPQAIICAVPFLRERDVRESQAGESCDDKIKNLIEGIEQHYSKVNFFAEKKKQELNCNIPIISMGHLFIAGSKLAQNEQDKELYVGNLLRVGANIFPESIDYVALGHLHVCQTVDKKDFIRYSGSPIAMDFGEAKIDRKVLKISFEDKEKVVSEIKVPTFQRLEKIEGDVKAIIKKIEELADLNQSIWLEIEYTGTKIVTELKNTIDDYTKDTNLEVLRIKNRSLVQSILDDNEYQSLEELEADEIFEKRLEKSELDDEEKKIITETYKELLVIIEEKKLTGDEPNENTEA